MSRTGQPPPDSYHRTREQSPFRQYLCGNHPLMVKAVAKFLACMRPSLKWFSQFILLVLCGYIAAAEEPTPAEKPPAEELKITRSSFLTVTSEWKPPEITLRIGMGKPGVIEILSENKPMVRFTAGKVTIADGVDADEAARKFLDSVARIMKEREVQEPKP